MLKVIFLLLGQPMATDCFGDSGERASPADPSPESSRTVPFLWVFHAVSDSHRFQVC